MAETRPLKVFLCHSKEDKPKVRELYRRLIADGFDAWLDEEKLMPGQDWDLEIRKAVRESDVVVVCLSNSSITKTGYVQKEIRFALDVADEQPLEGAIYIIPARLENCQVPSRLGKWQWVNIYQYKGYQRLRHSLELRAANSHTTPYISSLDDARQAFKPLMVRIPAGEFLMGVTSTQAQELVNEGGKNWKKWVQWEQPRHAVDLSEYSIGKYTITNREYQSFVKKVGYNPPPGWDGDQYPVKRGDHPVVRVSWNDALEYCKWLSAETNKAYRLPTEAEWEKAASGSDGNIYPWGNEFDLKKCNSKESDIGDTTPVSQFSPQGDSPYGCADMAGNVWEWCFDWFNENEYRNKSVKNPQGSNNGQYRIMRGGSFESTIRKVRCANRGKDYPRYFFRTIGFRVVLSLPKPPDNI